MLWDIHALGLRRNLRTGNSTGIDTAWGVRSGTGLRLCSLMLLLGMAARVNHSATVKELSCPSLLCRHMPRVRLSIDIDLFCTFLPNFAPLRLTYLGLCNTLLIWTKFHFSQFNAHLATCCRHGRLQRGTCLLPLSEPASKRERKGERDREPCLRADTHTHTHSAHLSLHLSREGQRDFIFLSP